MPTHTEAAAEAILRALRLEDLMLPGEDKDVAFRRLAKMCHPDTHPGDKKAEEAFKHLTALREGDAAPEVTIGKWTIQRPFAKGDIADLYLTQDGSVFKIARDRKDNDLMDREKSALVLIRKDETAKFRLYVPKLIDFISASARRANIIDYAAGYIALEEIGHRMGGKIDFRHIVWMMNRLFSCLGYVHRLGIVHGAIVPSHVLYKPADHSMQLVDWCYSTKIGETVAAVVSAYKADYPPEILKKRRVQASSDLFMAMKMVLRYGKDIPKRFQGLIELGSADYTGARPVDIWHFQDLWRQAAKEVYGEPKFLELNIPVN